jgi:hypothetical protein
MVFRIVSWNGKSFVKVDFSVEKYGERDSEKGQTVLCL